MKNLITITLLLISFSGSGQGNDSMSSTKQHLNIPGYLFSSDVYDSARPVYDTVPILMLVSDTSQYERDRQILREDVEEMRLLQDSNQMHFRCINPKKFMYTSSVASHVKGYEVIRFSYYHEHQFHVKYLNCDKKPLPIGVVVWNSKKIPK